MHAHIVDDAVLEFDVGIFFCYLAANIQPQAVCVFHDVGFVYAGDFFASHFAGIFEREADYPFSTVNRNWFDGYSGIVADLLFSVTV